MSTNPLEDLVWDLAERLDCVDVIAPSCSAADCCADPSGVLGHPKGWPFLQDLVQILRCTQSIAGEARRYTCHRLANRRAAEAWAVGQAERLTRSVVELGFGYSFAERG